MFKFMFGGSEQSLKLLAKIQGVFSSIIAIAVFFALFNGFSDTSVFAALVFGLAIAIIVWFALMISAWTLYSFADLVEYTKATHEEISQMSAGLAEYTRATNQTLNAMSSDLHSIAKHHAEREEADSETVQQEPAPEEAAEETTEEITNKEDN